MFGRETRMLLRHCLDQGTSKSALARQLGVSRDTIHRWMLPELVRREDLAAASALNSIEFNIARALGPALAGALIAAAGVGAAFLVNVASFAGVILVIARWRRPVRAPVLVSSRSYGVCPPRT